MAFYFLIKIHFSAVSFFFVFKRKEFVVFFFFILLLRIFYHHLPSSEIEICIKFRTKCSCKFHQGQLQNIPRRKFFCSFKLYHVEIIFKAPLPLHSQSGSLCFSKLSLKISCVRHDYCYLLLCT